MHSEEFDHIALNGTIVALLQKKSEGEVLSAEDLAVLTTWKQAHAENALLYDRLQDPGSFQQLLQEWHSIEKTKAASRERLLGLLMTEQDFRQPASRIHLLNTRWLRYAAAAILIIAISSGIYYITLQSSKPGKSRSVAIAQDIVPGTNKAVLSIGNDKTIHLSKGKTGIVVGAAITYNDGERIADADQMLQLATPKGGQYQARLPDGSKIWLNAASSVRFPSRFTDNRRTIEVTGEVYLEVAQNRRQPFVVKVRGTEILVLGTSFNINAYEDDAAIKTTLVEGSVRVGKIATLRPGQQAVIDNGLHIKSNIDLEQILAWKNGIFNFQDKKLEEVIPEIARWYDLEIVYASSIPDITLVGKISRNMKFSNMLTTLERLEVHYRIEGRKLIILP